MAFTGHCDKCTWPDCKENLSQYYRNLMNLNSEVVWLKIYGSISNLKALLGTFGAFI